MQLIPTYGLKDLVSDTPIPGGKSSKTHTCLSHIRKAGRVGRTGLIQKTKTLLRVRAFPKKECATSEDGDLTNAEGSLVQ